MSDDLFRPTVRERPVAGNRPWRPDSIFYPAFFGGPLAAATLGLINGRRLRIPRQQMWLILAAGLVAFGLRVLLTLWAGDRSAIRLGGAVTGALAWLAVIRFERRPFRAYTYADGEPAGMWGPGFLAFLGMGFIEGIVIFAVTS